MDKKCSKCKKVKSFSDFYRNTPNNRYRSDCKECKLAGDRRQYYEGGRREKEREYRQRPEVKKRKAERERIWRQKNPKLNASRAFCRSVRSRLKKYGYDIKKFEDTNSREFAKTVISIERKYPYCVFCGFNGPLTIDHIISLKKGGEPFAEENLQLLCSICNIKKGMN